MDLPKINYGEDDDDSDDEGEGHDESSCDDSRLINVEDIALSDEDQEETT